MHRAVQRHRQDLRRVTREAAYIVAEELRPETQRSCRLSLLVLGDEEAAPRCRTRPP